MEENSITTAARTIVIALTLVSLLVLARPSRSQDKPQSVSGTQESTELVMVLRDKQLRELEPERVARAIERLGEIKSVESIGDIVQLLTFRRNIQQQKVGDVIVGEHFITTFALYPATGALFRIGKPAVPALIEVIEIEETGSLASKIATYTVTQMFRDAPSEAVEQMRSAATKATSAQAAQRLLHIADKIERSMRQ